MPVSGLDAGIIYFLDGLQIRILCWTISIKVSFLHLGQNKGNLSKTVSGHIFVFVFPLQVGQRTQSVSFTKNLLLPYSASSVWLWLTCLKYHSTNPLGPMSPSATWLEKTVKAGQIFNSHTTRAADK